MSANRLNVVSRELQTWNTRLYQDIQVIGAIVQRWWTNIRVRVDWREKESNCWYLFSRAGKRAFMVTWERKRGYNTCRDVYYRYCKLRARIRKRSRLRLSAVK